MNSTKNSLQNDISQQEYKTSVRELKKVIHKNLKNKKLPSLEEQLAPDNF